MTDDLPVRASELTEAARNRLLHSAGLTIIANDDVCDELEGLIRDRLEVFHAKPRIDATGWLIEENAGGVIHWIALAENEWPLYERVEVKRRGVQPLASDDDWEIDKSRYLSPIKRVKDANEALRFARKEDAEALIKLFDRFLLCPVATEHAWPADRLEAFHAEPVVGERDRIALAHIIDPDCRTRTWEGSDDEQHRARLRACRERLKQWGDDGECNRDGQCDDCAFDMADALETAASKAHRANALTNAIAKVDDIITYLAALQSPPPVVSGEA